jgi:protein MpaA
MHGLTIRAAIGAAICVVAVSLCTAQALREPVPWEPLGRSSENRLIEFVQLGQGEQNVLIVGGMAGDDTQSVGLSERLVAHLTRFPTWLDGLKVTIVRDPNPDGRVRRTLSNAHGVEIDRNFHTQRWRKVSVNDRLISGREPESEPETRLLADLLADLKPQRIVVLSSCQLQPSLASCGPAESWARQVGTEMRCASKPIDPALAPGSLAVLAGHDLGIATLALRLPSGREIEGAWSDYKRAMLAAVSPGSSGDTTSLAPASTVMPPSTAAALPAATVSDASNQAPPANVLTYDELAGSTALVPVNRRRESALHDALAPVPLSSPDTTPRNSMENGPTTVTPPAKAPPVTQVRLERLPAIDRTRPTVRVRQQEPIPFYPDTGF